MSTLEDACSPLTHPERLEALAELSFEHRLAVARNVAAPAELLRRLASGASATLQAALATNPSLPTPLLWWLAASHPQEVIANPLFALVLLERPDLGLIPARAITALLSTGRMPRVWYAWAYEHGQRGHVGLLVALASWVHTPRELLLALCEVSSAVPALLANRGLCDEMVRRLEDSASVAVLEKFGASEHATPAWLGARARVDEARIRRVVAGNPRTPAGAIALLLQDPVESVRWAASRNPSLSLAQALRVLRASPKPLRRPGVEPMVQANGELLREALRAHDGQRRGRRGERRLLGGGVKPAVLRRAAVQQRSAGGLDLLARSRCREVRRLVAQNPATSADTLAVLADDRCPEVRRAVGRHPATAEEVRARLGLDPVASVRKAVRAFVRR